MSEELTELPSGWIKVSLKDIVYRITKGTTPTSLGFRFADAGILFVKVESLSSQRINHELCAFIGADADEALSRSRLQENDVLFSIAGTLGRVAVVHRDDLPANTNQAICIIRLVPPISSRYIAQFLSSPLIEKKIQEIRRGVALQNLNLKQVSEFQILLSPLNEQERIADKLDRLLARVNACRERCDRIPPILKRFRQSVLAVATSGELTEDWRENTSSTEGLDSDYGTLPVSWEWRLIREVGSVQLGRQRAPKYHSGQHMRPYLRVQNIFEDRIDLLDVMEMDFPPDDFEKYQLHFGDILLNEGQSPELLGRPAMYRDELPGACFTNTLVRFQAFDIVNPDFALLVFRHYMHCGRFRREGTITTNIAHLGAGRFANIEFPLPPLEEQQEIVCRAKALFGYADHLEARYQTARDQVYRLTPALLDKAFRGELVPQDPNDEPASVLLEQIRSELATAKVNKTERRQRVTVDSTPSIAQVIMLTRKDIQPSHLSSILKTRGSLTAEDLWTASQLEIDDFYDQLKDEEEQGLLRETKGEGANAPRLLEAA